MSSSLPLAQSLTRVSRWRLMGVTGDQRERGRGGENNSDIVADTVMAGWQACAFKICAMLGGMTLYKWATKGQPLNVCIIANANLLPKSRCQGKIRARVFFHIWCDLLISIWGYSLISQRWRQVFRAVVTCRGLILSSHTFKHTQRSSCALGLQMYRLHICILNINTSVKHSSNLWQRDTHPCGSRCTCCSGHFSSFCAGRARRWRSWGSTSRWRQCLQ